jgi:hypothetical protein
MTEKIARLEKENLIMLQKLIMEIKEHNQEKLNCGSLRRLVMKQADHLRGFKHLFWRLYWKK